MKVRLDDNLALASPPFSPFYGAYPALRRAARPPSTASVVGGTHLRRDTVIPQ
jgi:hypothetical protein